MEELRPLDRIGVLGGTLAGIEHGVGEDGRLESRRDELRRPRDQRTSGRGKARSAGSSAQIETDRHDWRADPCRLIVLFPILAAAERRAADHRVRPGELEVAEVVDSRAVKVAAEILQRIDAEHAAVRALSQHPAPVGGQTRVQRVRVGVQHGGCGELIGLHRRGSLRLQGRRDGKKQCSEDGAQHMTSNVGVGRHSCQTPRRPETTRD